MTDTPEAERHSPPFEVTDDRLAPLVREVRRSLFRCLQTGLARHGVAAGHWTFLRNLWSRDDINQRRLSDLAGVMEPTTVAALQAMERLGYISRRRRPGNRKNIYVFLTPKGRALHDILMPVGLAINARALSGISKPDLAATQRTLLAMIDNLAREEGAVASKAPASPPANLPISPPTIEASAAAFMGAAPRRRIRSAD